jgi:hypothetical protein
MSKPVAFILLILVGLGSGVRAQSLADIAKKEEERRKAIPAPAKVYTNKDLTAVPAGSPPPPATTAATTPADAPKDAEKDKDAKAPDAKAGPVKDQAYWSGRKKDLQAKLDHDETFAIALQSRINVLSADFVNRDDPAQRAVIGRDRQKALDELARQTKAIQDDKKALVDLDEEARRAGVPPGWLR